MTDILDIGCQIEYTVLNIKGNDWYTFALEWFGDQMIEPDTALLQSILADIVLDED